METNLQWEQDRGETTGKITIIGDLIMRNEMLTLKVDVKILILKTEIPDRYP